MGYFDFLIDKESNGEPNSSLSYIYMLEMIWRPNKLGDIPIKKYSVFFNVKRLKNGSYEFEDKEGNLFRCNYSWALAENTPKNWRKIKKYEKKLRKFKKFEKRIDQYRNNIITLKIDE